MWSSQGHAPQKRHNWIVGLKAGLILSVQSNKFVQSKMKNGAVQKHKVEDIIVQFSKSYCCAVQDAAFF